MSARDRKLHEYRLRLEAEAAEAESHDGQDSPQDDVVARDRRIENQSRWVDLQIQQAIRRGEFDDLPGSGKPIPGIDRPHDPDWWIKQLIERERISVLPPALALRKEDGEMDATLDHETTPDGVRRIVEDFNARVVEARRQLQGGPPVITPLRDVDDAIRAWAERRASRVAEQRAAAERIRREEVASAPPSWWRRLVDRLLARRHRIA